MTCEVCGGKKTCYQSIGHGDFIEVGCPVCKQDEVDREFSRRCILAARKSTGRGLTPSWNRTATVPEGVRAVSESSPPSVDRLESHKMAVSGGRR